MNVDELSKVASEVASKYKISSIDDLKELAKNKLTIESFTNEVRVAVKGGKVVFRSLPSSSFKTDDTRLNNIIRDLYKGESSPVRIGSGSTADAIRNELKTGQPTEGVFHSQKGQQYISALNNWTKDVLNASDNDKNIANTLLQDLIDALAGK